jgi:protein-S-isoprenylcysteine O-methyltransferase Ste14
MAGRVLFFSAPGWKSGHAVDSAAAALAIFLLAILSILLYQILARLEERALLDQYGPQEAYRWSVPQFVPRLRRRSEAQISS